MRRRRWSLSLLALAVLLILMLPDAALADGSTTAVSSMQGSWNVYVNWVNPEIIGSYTMNVTMLTSFFGKISTRDHVGYLITNGKVTLWTIDRPWVALYVGAVSSSSGSGKMINTTGNHGTWTASKVTSAVQPLGTGASVGAVTGD